MYRNVSFFYTWPNFPAISGVSIIRFRIYENGDPTRAIFIEID